MNEQAIDLTHKIEAQNTLLLPKRSFISKATGLLSNLILIVMLLVGANAFILNLINKKVNTVVASNKVIQEFALKNSAQTVLLKLIDTKLGSNASIQTKVNLANTIYSLSTVKNIPLNIICGLIEVESQWVPNLTSSANAKGLMQILPAYARPYLRNERIEYAPNVLLDPVANVTVGIQMLADLHAGHFEAGKESANDFTFTLHSYFWGSNNTEMLYGKRDSRVNVPNMSYPMRVFEAAKKYKEMGL